LMMVVHETWTDLHLYFRMRKVGAQSGRLLVLLYWSLELNLKVWHQKWKDLHLYFQMRSLELNLMMVHETWTDLHLYFQTRKVGAQSGH